MGVSWLGKVSNTGIDNKRGESLTHLSRYMHIKFNYKTTL